MNGGPFVEPPCRWMVLPVHGWGDSTNGSEHIQYTYQMPSTLPSTLDSVHSQVHSIAHSQTRLAVRSHEVLSASYQVRLNAETR